MVQTYIKTLRDSSQIYLILSVEVSGCVSMWIPFPFFRTLPQNTSLFYFDSFWQAPAEGIEIFKCVLMIQVTVWQWHGGHRNTREKNILATTIAFESNHDEKPRFARHESLSFWMFELPHSDISQLPRSSPSATPLGVASVAMWHEWPSSFFTLTAFHVDLSHASYLPLCVRPFVILVGFCNYYLESCFISLTSMWTKEFHCSQENHIVSNWVSIVILS